MEDCLNTTTNGPNDHALKSRGLGYLVSVFKSLKNYESYISLPGIRQWGGCWLETLQIYDGLRPLSNSPLFRVAYSPLQPYVTKTIENGTIELSGFFIEFWTTLGEWLEFRTEFVEMDEDTAKRLLIHGAVDVYLYPWVVMPEDDKIYEYTLPVASLWYQLFIRQPETKVSGAAFVRAMSPGMWLMTVTSVIILSVALWGTAAIRVYVGAESGLHRPRDPEVASFEYERILRRKCKARIERESRQTLSAGSCFLSVLGVLCSQGFQDNPETASLRLVTFSALIFGLMVYNAYAAVLVSYLATGSTLLPFKGLEDFAQVGSHVLCVRPESYAYSIFINPETHRPLQKWRGLINVDPCVVREKTSKSQSIEKATRTTSMDANSSSLKMVWNPIEAMCSGRGAVLDNPSIITSMAKFLPNDCHIVPVGERILPSFVSILLRPDFPYTHALDISIVRLRSAGITDYMERKWFGAKPRAGTQSGAGLGSIITSSGIERDDGNLYVQVSLGHVGSVLLVYGGCLIIPVAVLFVEIAVHRARSRRKQKNRNLPAQLPNKITDRTNKLLYRRYREPKLLKP